MRKASKNKHLTMEDRVTIEVLVGTGLSFSAIARRIGKDRTTVAKEVRARRYRVGTGREPCPRLLKPPYVCNGCPERARCGLGRLVYTSGVADNEYRKTLSASRAHLRITEEQAARINAEVAPLMIERHHSVNQVYINHPECLPFSKSTFYRYIDCRILAVRNIDLPRKLRYKPGPAARREEREARNPAIRVGRFHRDFEDWLEENPELEVVEMDTVVGIQGGKGGKCLLTMLWRRTSLMKVILLPYRKARYVTEAFVWLREALGEAFGEVFPAILTDNGSEFSDPESIEVSHLTGRKETSVFYCDPNCSWQKGKLERNHEYIRYILPRGTSFAGLTQRDCDLIADHINSVPRVALCNRTPYEAGLFYLGEEKMDRLGFRPVPMDEVSLSIKLIR